MASNNSDTWSPRYGASPAQSGRPRSPSGYTYSEGSYSPHTSSGSTGSTNIMRRITVSPSPSPEDLDDSYTDENSIEEVEAALNSLENDIDDTEQALSEWSGSNRAPSYTTGSLSGSYTGTYTGSTSYINLPNIASRSPSMAAVGLGARLSRITERSEESRPSSGAFSARDLTRPTSTGGDGLRRSALLSGAATHGRSTTEPTGDPTLPPPGRATELIAVFETNVPGAAHARAASAPGIRSSSPFYTPSQTTSTVQTTTGYTHGTSTFGFHSRSSSPTKSRNGSTISYTDTKPTMSSLMSPPPPPPKNETSKLRAVSPGAGQLHAGAPSHLSPSTQTTSTLTSMLSPSQTTTGTRSFTRTETPSYTTSVTNTAANTPISSLRRPQTSPRSPLASVRNIVTLWKERTPVVTRPTTGKISTSTTTPSTSPQDGEGLLGIRRRVQRAGERLRDPSLRAGEQDGAVGDEGGLRTVRRSGGLPPGFDIGELSQYAQSNEAPLHIGLLWYLNVHAPPPYRWQRCQALLYPHMLLLSWLAPGGGRGIVALDLLNCTTVQSIPSPTHPSARDDVGTVAARLQSSESGGQPLVDMLVPFQMLYADGIERLAAESLLERQRWVNRIWDAVNRPISAPNTSDITRSPTGSIRTILSIDSITSSTSTGSRSTVYVPPMSTLTDIPDFQSDFSSNSRLTSSNLGVARRVSLVSSHHKHTVDDTVIQNQEYVYPGDPRHIPPTRGNSLRRTGSMSDLDQEFARALKARKSGLVPSPVTISSGPSLGQDIFVTPPPSLTRGTDRSRSEHSGSQSDEAFFSGGLSGSSFGMRSNVSSAYYSQSGDQTTTGLFTDETMRGLSSGGTLTQMTSTLSYRGSDSNSYSQDQSSHILASSGLSSLSRAREVRRRLNRVSSRSLATTVSDGSSDKENSLSGSASYSFSGTPGSQSYGLSGGYTPGSGDLTTLSGGYTPGSAEYSPLSGSYSPRSGSYTQSQSGSQGFTSGSGSYTLDSGSYTPSGSGASNGNGTPSSGSVAAVGNGSSSESRSTEGSFTPGTETGYDVCPSSDLSGLTPPTTTEYSITPSPSSPVYVAIRPVPVVGVGSEELARPRVRSSRESIESFDTCPTIPSESDYATAEELSTYGTARSLPSKPPSTEYLTASEPAPPSEYITAGVIPSEESTPRLSSLDLSDERLLSDVVSIPSRVPTIRSLASSTEPSGMQPQDVPLPPSVGPSERSLPMTPLLPALRPAPPGRVSPAISVVEDSQSPASARSFRGLPPLPADFAAESDESLLEPLPPRRRASPRSDRSRATSSLLPVREPATMLARTRVSTVSSTTESLTVPLDELPHTSPAPSTPLPPSPILWAGDNETDRSYDSSQLHPSPSMVSVAMPEGPDRSYETSFLRPSGSIVSSANRLSTLPVSSVLTTGTPLPQLATPVLRSSESSSSITPSELISSSSSSFSSDLSSSRSQSQPSLSMSLLGPLEIAEGEVGEEEPVSPRTISTLLDTARASVRSTSRSPTPTPIPPRTHTVTPEGSVIISISTPYGSGGTEQASLRTESDESIRTPRDLAHDLDKLAENLRQYDEARGQENKGLADTVKALRDELQDLSDFLRRTPPPNVVRIVEERIAAAPQAVPRSRTAISRSVGGSSEITSFHVHSLEVPESIGAALTRASSITSVGSFLSSHHSDDLSLYGSASSPMHPVSDVGSEYEDESSFVSSSDVTLPSEPMPTTPVQLFSQPHPPSPASTARPTFDLMAPLNAIREQLSNLTNEQAAALRKMESLSGREYPEIPQMHNKITRVEDLLHDLIRRFENQPPPPVVTIPISQPTPVPTTDRVPEPQTAIPGRISFTDSEDSSLIRRIESDLLTSRTGQPAGPSFIDQLQEILSSSVNLIPPAVEHPPPLHRFRYEPLEGMARPRSASPASLESILQRRMSAPAMADDFYEILRGLSRERRTSRPGPQRPPPSTEDLGDQGAAVPHASDRSRGEDAWNERIARMEANRYKRPPPQPVFPQRPSSAPESGGGQAAESWYRPPRTEAQQQPTLDQTRPLEPAYVPLPPGPTYVQLPPIFEQLMSFVRESHLAQTATYQQQQDLSRYMRELNDWLARDVNDRQDELNAVTARLDHLTNVANTLLALQSRRPESTGSESDQSVVEQRPHQFIQHPMQMPIPEPFLGPRIQQQQPVHPVVPLTPEPHFAPVIPSPMRQPMLHVQPVQPMGIIPPPPVLVAQTPFARPSTMPPPGDSPTGPFIPPRPDEPLLPPNIIVRSGSTPSSSVSSSGSSGSGDARSSSRRRRAPSEGRRTRSSSMRRYPGGRQPTNLTYEDDHSTDSSPERIQVIQPPVSQQPSVMIQPQPPVPIPATPGIPYPLSQQSTSQPQPTNIIIHPAPPPMAPFPQPVGLQAQPVVVAHSGPSGSPGSSSPSSHRRSSRRPSRRDSSHRSRGRDRSGSTSSSSSTHQIVALPGGPGFPMPQQMPPYQQPPYHPMPSYQPTTVVVPQEGHSDSPARSEMSYRPGRGSPSRDPTTIVAVPPTAPTMIPVVQPMAPTMLPIPTVRDPSVMHVPEGRGRTRSRSPHRGRRRHYYSRSPTMSYPSDYSSRERRRRDRRRRPRDYSYSPRDDDSYSSRSPSSHRRVTRYSPPITRSPTRHSTRSPTRSDGRAHHDHEGEIPRASSTRHRPPREHLSGTEQPHRLPPSERDGPRDQEHSPPRSALPSEEHPLLRRADEAPRAESPSPLPRPVASGSQRPRVESRSPTPTRSPTPRYVRALSERGRDEPITVIVPRRDRSPTIVSYAPEEERPEDRGEIPRRSTSQRSEHFSAEPSLYAPSRRRSAQQPTGAEPVATEDTGEVPRDEEESYRGQPTIQEPSRRVSRRPSARTEVEPGSPHRTSSLDLEREEEQARQIQRLNEVESRLGDVESSMREAEDRRELAFRQNEDDRYHIFLENQERRDQEARERAERLLQAIDNRISSLVPSQPPPPSPRSETVSGEAEAVVGDTQSMIESVRTASQEAAMQYSRDIQEIIKAEREEFAREREATAADRDRLLAEAQAERNRLAEQREQRIQDLEEQLAVVRRELEDEKQRRITEEADTQERQRQELEERDEVLRSQLGDITNLIHDQRQVCEAKKDLMQAQWEEKQSRRLEKEAKWIELRDMVLKVHEDMENDRAKAEECRRAEESKPGYDQLIEELRRQNAEQRELLTNLSETWRADCASHHEETINAVRQTAQEQVPFNVQGYLDEFSKALATEVRMLLGEVGKLREERRNLHHEMGFLLTMKSKYGPGGEFEPEWRPGMPPGGPPGPPGDGPPPEPQPPAPEQQHVRPGWRPVRRPKKKKETAPAPAAPVGPTTTTIDPRHQIQSWATWQPDPINVPSSPSVEPTLLVPNRASPGLFGPRTPRSSYYGS